MINNHREIICSSPFYLSYMIGFVESFCREKGTGFALSTVWEKGGEGGLELADRVLEAVEKDKAFKPLYEDELPIEDKIRTVAKRIYGSRGVSFAPAALREIKKLESLGFSNLPVCMAKTQYSLSDDASKLGRPEGFDINVREVYVSAGAGFVVAVTGNIMTMPGLSKDPAAYHIDVSDDGLITGLF